MASVPSGDSDDDSILKRRRRLTGYDVVYTRRTANRVKKTHNSSDTATCTSPVLGTTATAGVDDYSNLESVNGSATASLIVARSPRAISTHGGDGADFGLVHLTAPLEEEVGKYQGHGICQKETNRDGIIAHQPPELVKQDGSCSTRIQFEKDNASGSFEQQNLEETADEVRAMHLREASENNRQDCTYLESHNFPTQENVLTEEKIPDSAERAEAGGLDDGHEFVEPLAVASFGDLIRFNLGKRSASGEIEDLNLRFKSDLETVRKMFKELETKELQLATSAFHLDSNKLSANGSLVGSKAPNTVEYDLSQFHGRPSLACRRPLLRINTGVGSTIHQERRPVGLARVNSDIGIRRSNVEPKLYNRQLSVAAVETNHGFGEFLEKEKRTPKANQFYKKTEFLLAKDRLPSESNKKSKNINGRKRSVDGDHAFHFGFAFEKDRNRVFRSCSRLLQHLMKHKFGWVFNTPVDAEKLGLIDYHDIIKRPMDLGTIKDRLSHNWYKFPREFAEDVRLVFYNAMAYNPKGQDVHIMAEQLLHIFEEKWADIEAEINDYLNYQLYKDGRSTTTSSRRGPAQSYVKPSSFAAARVAGYLPSPVQPATYVSAPIASHATSDKHGPMSTYDGGPPSQRSTSHAGRIPAPKKPKAKDPDKRDMTPEEKQRLSKHLQDLPSEKLDAIVHIINKRNTAISQRDDEIEVDIDSVDPETLWELDRLVTNYKKSLSKNRRRAELALQARSSLNQNSALENATPAVTGVRRENGVFEKSINHDGEPYNKSSSSGSSSSTSDSGSSSSDSDSDSSSGDGSDAGAGSPRT